MIFRSLAEVPDDFGPCAITIGNFDGVHLGASRDRQAGGGDRAGRGLARGGDDVRSASHQAGCAGARAAFAFDA